MQERQTSIHGETYKLQKPFLVLATQNPIETEGTYKLPEAQVDRFAFKLLIDYPDKHQEKSIIQRNTQGLILKTKIGNGQYHIQMIVILVKMHGFHMMKEIVVKHLEFFFLQIKT